MSTNKDFANGFLAGMATRGMITTGLKYQKFIEVNLYDGYEMKRTHLSEGQSDIKLPVEQNSYGGVADSITFGRMTLTDSITTEVLDI